MTRETAITELLSQLSPPQADELRRATSNSPDVSDATRAYWERIIARWLED